MRQLYAYAANESTPNFAPIKLLALSFKFFCTRVIRLTAVNATSPRGFGVVIGGSLTSVFAIFPSLFLLFAFFRNKNLQTLDFSPS